MSIATLISRLLGYARDMIIASAFGATMAADAFYVAYKIPNLLRSLLGEGSLSTSLIPVYTGYLARKEDKEAEELLGSVFGIFGLLFIALTILGIIFAPGIIRLIAPGFTADPEKFKLTLILTRIMFPFLMTVGFGAIALGVLNSWRLFFIPALAPSFLSISEILFILFLSSYFDPPIKVLAYGVLVGGVLQFLVQLYPIIKRSVSLRISFNFNHPGIKRIASLMLPAIIGLSITQINSFVDTICATLLTAGSVTHLYYGNRLMQFPLAMFGTAVATVTLPIMSEYAANKRTDLLKNTLSSSIRSVSFLIIPSAIGLIFLGRPIVQMLFERGQFLPTDTSAAYFALALYSSGLFFYAGIKVFVSAFHSLQDTKTPVKIACFAMLINMTLNILVITVPVLREKFSSAGLAGATSAAAGVNLLLLIFTFIKKQGKFSDGKILPSISKHIFSAGILAIFLYRANIFTSDFSVYLRTPILIFSGALIYFGVAFLLRTPELSLIGKLLRR